MKEKKKLPLICPYCKKTFYLSKRRIDMTLNRNRTRRTNSLFCSHRCARYYYHNPIFVNCAYCNKTVQKKKSSFAKPNQNLFCSCSCAATYNNTHKTKGTRRSKLEKWLEEKLTTMYPHMPIEFNAKGAIQSELDIYIPSLKLAFELNGIYHYEPIHGDKKLTSVINNDNNKMLACAKHKISLCVIDTSSLKNFKENKASTYLDIISKIINETIEA